MKTMTTNTARRTSAFARAHARRRGAGFTAIEEVLMIAAVAGCFVYPLSRAAMDSGRNIAQQVERGHATILEQR